MLSRRTKISIVVGLACLAFGVGILVGDWMDALLGWGLVAAGFLWVGMAALEWYVEWIQAMVARRQAAG